jgi:hypothetical protein
MVYGPPTARAPLGFCLQFSFKKTFYYKIVLKSEKCVLYWHVLENAILDLVKFPRGWL